jgi:hypothetical protein
MDLQAALSPCIEHIWCAAHTLQLAVLDWIKNSRAKAVIDRIQNFLKECRMSKINDITKRRAKKTLVIDTETRWGSTYMMIEHLVEL